MKNNENNAEFYKNLFLYYKKLYKKTLADFQKTIVSVPKRKKIDKEYKRVFLDEQESINGFKVFYIIVMN